MIKKIKTIFGAAVLILAGVAAGGFLSFGNEASANNEDSYAPFSYEVAAESINEDDMIQAGLETEFVPQDITEAEVLKTEYDNLKKNEDNSDRTKSDMMDEAEALSKLNQTDNKDWTGKVELWVDGEGWVDASTLSEEEIARITGEVPAVPVTTPVLNPNFSSTVTSEKPAEKTTGHYEEVWVEDIPGFYEDELVNVAYYVCNGCGEVLGTTEEEMAAHCKPAMIERRLECGSWRVDYKLESTGNQVYVSPQGHYEKVWVLD